MYEQIHKHIDYDYMQNIHTWPLCRKKWKKSHRCYMKSKSILINFTSLQNDVNTIKHSNSGW